MKPGELHRTFQAKLEAVSVKREGDANFGALHACWTQLLRMYPLPETVQHQVMSYGFKETAAKIFLQVQSDPRK